MSTVLAVPAQVANAVICVVGTVVGALLIALATSPADITSALAVPAHTVVAALHAAITVAALHGAVAVELAAVVLIGEPSLANAFAVRTPAVGHEGDLLRATLVRAVAVAAFKPAVGRLASLQRAVVIRAGPTRLAVAQRLAAQAVARAFGGAVLVAALDLTAGVLRPAVVAVRPALVFVPSLPVPARALARVAIAVAIALALAITVAALEGAITQGLARVIFVVPAIVALAQAVVALAVTRARHGAVRASVAAVIAHAVAIHHQAVTVALQWGGRRDGERVRRGWRWRSRRCQHGERRNGERSRARLSEPKMASQQQR